MRHQNEPYGGEEIARLEIEPLEERIVPGTVMINTPSGMTFSRMLNETVVGRLSIAQAHTDGVITWTPTP